MIKTIWQFDKHTKLVCQYRSHYIHLTLPYIAVNRSDVCIRLYIISLVSWGLHLLYISKYNASDLTKQLWLNVRLTCNVNNACIYMVMATRFDFCIYALIATLSIPNYFRQSSKSRWQPLLRRVNMIYACKINIITREWICNNYVSDSNKAVTRLHGCIIVCTFKRSCFVA